MHIHQAVRSSMRTGSLWTSEKLIICSHAMGYCSTMKVQEEVIHISAKVGSLTTDLIILYIRLIYVLPEELSTTSFPGFGFWLKNFTLLNLFRWNICYQKSHSNSCENKVGYPRRGSWTWENSCFKNLKSLKDVFKWRLEFYPLLKYRVRSHSITLPVVG